MAPGFVVPRSPRLASAFESIGNPLRYAGAHSDLADSAFLRNRGYDPDLQRFLAEDPIGLAGGINPYTFVGNRPMEGRDPSALATAGLYNPP